MARAAAKFGVTASAVHRHRKHAAAKPEAATWDGAAKLSAEVVAGALEAPPVVSAVAGPVDARAVAVQTLGTLQRTMSEVPPDKRATVANSITTVAKLIAKLDGDLELTHGAVIRSKPFREMMTLIETTLSAFPDAAKALAEAFGEFMA